MKSLLLALFLSGCVTPLEAAGLTIDSATVVLKSECPEETPTCEAGRQAINTATRAYNKALIAEHLDGPEKEPAATLAKAAADLIWQVLGEIVK